MHFAFILYGERRAVEKTLREMEAQKHALKVWTGLSTDKDLSKKPKILWIEGQVRQLPFGIYEYIFPKEDKEVILNTIGLADNHYLPEMYKKLLRKALGYKKAEAGKEGANHYLWQMENTAIIPIGIKEDKDYFDEKLKMWHEGL